MTGEACWRETGIWFWIVFLVFVFLLCTGAMLVFVMFGILKKDLQVIIVCFWPLKLLECTGCFVFFGRGGGVLWFLPGFAFFNVGHTIFALVGFIMVCDVIFFMWFLKLLELLGAT